MKRRYGDYMVHFIPLTPSSVQFQVYPILEWTHLETGIPGTSYIDKEKAPDTLDVFNEDLCLRKLEGHIKWKEQWDSLLKFPDEEYWHDELQELTQMLYEFIIPWSKDYIRYGELSTETNTKRILSKSA